MMDFGFHPVFIVMAVISIGVATYQLYQYEPKSAPLFLLISVVGAILRAIYLLRERQRRRSPAGLIDFELLHAKTIRQGCGWLKENVKGHDETIDRLLAGIQRGLSLAGPGRPLGAFLLAGPPGTGKTFLARLVSHALYPESEPVVLDMSQFRTAQDGARLIDAPAPGVPGPGGALTQPVQDNPYRVVILDEIQSCHPDVRRCLSDILNSGRCLEKSSGQAVHFNACVFLATCHTDAAEPGADAARLRDSLCRATGLEKPFVSRFEEVYAMEALSPVRVAEVACLQLAKHWRDYGIEVTYASPELIFEVMRKNSEFKENGVRELAHLTRSMVGPALEKAKQGGATKVKLGFDKGTGEVTAVLEAAA